MPKYMRTYLAKSGILANIHFNKAVCHYYRNSNEFAVEEFSKAIEQSPSKGGAYSARAAAFLKMNKTANALEDISCALSATPEEEALYLLRADCYLRAKNLKAACDDLSKVISLSPDGGRIYYYRARVYEQLGLKTLMERDLKSARALGVDAANPDGKPFSSIPNADRPIMQPRPIRTLESGRQ